MDAHAIIKRLVLNSSTQYVPHCHLLFLHSCSSNVLVDLCVCLICSSIPPFKMHVTVMYLVMHTHARVYQDEPYLAASCTVYVFPNLPLHVWWLLFSNEMLGIWPLVAGDGKCIQNIWQLSFGSNEWRKSFYWTSFGCLALCPRLAQANWFLSIECNNKTIKPVPLSEYPRRTVRVWGTDLELHFQGESSKCPCTHILYERALASSVAQDPNYY